MQNLAQILEVGVEFPIHRDTDFRHVAHLIALSMASQQKEKVRRMNQSFSDRSKRFKPESTAFARLTEQHKRDVEKASVLNKYDIRENWFKASKDYGYITRVRGRQETPPVRHPQFWLEVKKMISEKEWRRMWSSGRVRSETLAQIRAYIVGTDPNLEDSLMRTVDYATFNRRRGEYDEEKEETRKPTQKGRNRRNTIGQGKGRRRRNNRPGRGRRPKPE